MQWGNICQYCHFCPRTAQLEIIFSRCKNDQWKISGIVFVFHSVLQVFCNNLYWNKGLILYFYRLWRLSRVLYIWKILSRVARLECRLHFISEQRQICKLMPDQSRDWARLCKHGEKNAFCTNHELKIGEKHAHSLVPNYFYGFKLGMLWRIPFHYLAKIIAGYQSANTRGTESPCQNRRSERTA